MQNAPLFTPLINIVPGQSHDAKAIEPDEKAPFFSLNDGSLHLEVDAKADASAEASDHGIVVAQAFLMPPAQLLAAPRPPRGTAMEILSTLPLASELPNLPASPLSNEESVGSVVTGTLGKSALPLLADSPPQQPFHLDDAVAQTVDLPGLSSDEARPKEQFPASELAEAANPDQVEVESIPTHQVGSALRFVPPSTLANLQEIEPDSVVLGPITPAPASARKVLVAAEADDSSGAVSPTPVAGSAATKEPTPPADEPPLQPALPLHSHRNPERVWPRQAVDVPPDTRVEPTLPKVTFPAPRRATPVADLKISDGFLPTGQAEYPTDGPDNKLVHHVAVAPEQAPEESLLPFNSGGGVENNWTPDQMPSQMRGLATARPSSDSGTGQASEEATQPKVASEVAETGASMDIRVSAKPVMEVPITGKPPGRDLPLEEMSARPIVKAEAVSALSIAPEVGSATRLGHTPAAEGTSEHILAKPLAFSELRLRLMTMQRSAEPATGPIPKKEGQTGIVQPMDDVARPELPDERGGGRWASAYEDGDSQLPPPVPDHHRISGVGPEGLVPDVPTEVLPKPDTKMAVPALLLNDAPLRRTSELDIGRPGAVKPSLTFAPTPVAPGAEEGAAERESETVTEGSVKPRPLGRSDDGGPSPAAVPSSVPVALVALPLAFREELSTEVRVPDEGLGAISAPVHRSGFAADDSSKRRVADGSSIVRQVVQSLGGKDGTVSEIHLSPEELGSVVIEIQTDGDKVVMAVAAERPETLDLLRRHSERLLSELRAAGFGQMDLAFSENSNSEGRRDDRQPYSSPQLSGGAPARAPHAARGLTTDLSLPSLGAAGAGLYLRV